MRSYTFISRRILQVGACGASLLLGGAMAKAAAASSSPAVGKTSRSDAASGAGERATCAATFKSAEERVRSERFVEASQLFLQCANPTCGELLASECSHRNNDLASNLSSVVFLVTDRTGEPLTDVQVNMDGAPLTARLDGLSLPVEAGPHEFSFISHSTVFASQKVVIVRGQRNRAIAVSQPASATGTTQNASAPVSVSAS